MYLSVQATADLHRSVDFRVKVYCSIYIYEIFYNNNIFVLHNSKLSPFS